jgi:hypothetical protein
MTAPGVYAEGLRVLWLLFSRGVSAAWDGTAVVIAPPDPTADGAIEALETVLRPDADGCSYLQRARARHASFLREAADAKPADATSRQWRDAIEGLESFLLSGWGDEALRLGWPRDELFKVPELWSQIGLRPSDRWSRGHRNHSGRDSDQNPFGRDAGFLPEA